MAAPILRFMGGMDLYFSLQTKTPAGWSTPFGGGTIILKMFWLNG